MDSISPTLLLSSPLDLKDERETNRLLAFDSTLLQNQASFPTEFIWPNGDLVDTTQEELKEPLVDLQGFFSGDDLATSTAAGLIRAACLTHGFFQVTNHGVDPGLIRAAHEHMDAFFRLPINKKLRARRKPGSVFGYSGAHADRYSSKLPWKETLSFGYHGNRPDPGVVGYFKSVLGDDFEETGWIYERYCQEMRQLSLSIMELLAISLGVERSHYRDFFEDGSSIMRCNYYPPCKDPGLTLGTGPHCDPTSLTILHQDDVGGLEVFANNKWQAVRPRPDALVINLGDTFMALSNGRYQSCLHRAVVKRERERRSLAYFVCPREDKVVRPPHDLVVDTSSSRSLPPAQQQQGQLGQGQLGGAGAVVGPRKYPDFTWSDLLEFTQSHYRADVTTLQSFIHWLLLSPHHPPKPSN